MNKKSQRNTKIKTSELIGPALDWAVAKCENVEVRIPCVPKTMFRYLLGMVDMQTVPYHPTTNWAQGGPIKEREIIRLNTYDAGVTWIADGPRINNEIKSYEGPTQLISSMRCYVASKLGNEVEIPEELI